MSHENLIYQLNNVTWGSPSQITLKCDNLIATHMLRTRKVLEYLKNKRNINTVDAHGYALTAGYNTDEYSTAMSQLFNDVLFENAIVREPIILTITGFIGWSLDDELKNFDNPWEPLVEICKMGYTSSFDDSPNGEEVNLIVGCQSGLSSFKY